MVEYIKWFQLKYPGIKNALLECNHNFSIKDTNPYHIEGDCWSHTMMVCKIAELKKFDIEVQVAALLHDIGKPFSRSVNLKKGFVYFRGHEEKSTLMAKPILEAMVKDGLVKAKDVQEILTIIKLHGEVYKNLNNIKKMLKKSPKVLQHLLELNLCDDLGRFIDVNLNQAC